MYVYRYVNIDLYVFECMCHVAELANVDVCVRTHVYMPTDFRENHLIAFSTMKCVYAGMYVCTLHVHRVQNKTHAVTPRKRERV